jgi:Chitobiase/beta-hexosaminidase C-terminal domain
MSDPTTGATIHYMTNGTDPTTSSPVYKKPFKIRGKGIHVIKARATKTGLNDSAVTSTTFAFGK